MLTSQFTLPIHGELKVDLFAGGGGASTGIEQATGFPPDIAINHDPEAVALHQANHPQTQHFCSDVFEVDPLTVTDGRPVGLLWASPDCKHFSKAKGGKPVSKKIRSLAWVVIKWAKLVQPRVIFLENVEEFQTWGPLGDDNMPCPKRKGQTFNRWVAQLRNLGYSVEWRELRACDFGAPTIRKRLFLVARRDGMPIVWPEPTHAAPGSLALKAKKLKPWRTAAECIDWSIPAPSIFERARPLADATCTRIAKGIMRYVIQAPQPFIIPTGALNEQTNRHEGSAAAPGAEAIQRTGSGSVRPHRAPAKPGAGRTKEGGRAQIASATLIQTGYGERPGQSPRVLGLDKPLGTVVGSQKHALVSSFLAKHYTGVVGSDMADPMATVTSVDHHSLVTANLVGVGARAGQSRPRGMDEPLATITAKADVALVASNLIHMGHGEGKDGGKRFSHGIRDIADPLNTITASGAAAGLVQSFLVKYYGTDQDPQLQEPLHTVTTKDRFGLVMVKGEPYAIVDIGLRMLTPRELYRAQGFPESYIIDRGADGRPLTKTAQVRMCGNSVCPPLARALVSANYTDAQVMREAA